VHNDIVYGLKFACKIKTARLGMEASNDEEVLGSFSPTVESHVVQLQPEEVPNGFIARRAYDGEAMLFDLDG